MTYIWLVPLGIVALLLPTFSGGRARKNKFMEKRFQTRPTVDRPASTSAEVLGTNGEVDPQFRKYFDQLVEMRESLLERRGHFGDLSTVEEANHSVNIADRASDEYDTGAQFSQFSNDQDAIYEIDQAFRRIDDGTCGICEATGKPIPEDRLDVIPWARFAKDVEAEVERDERAHRPPHIF